MPAAYIARAMKIIRTGFAGHGDKNENSAREVKMIKTLPDAPISSVVCDDK